MALGMAHSTVLVSALAYGVFFYLASREKLKRDVSTARLANLGQVKSRLGSKAESPVDSDS
jgi:hypothetical protein